MDYRTKHERTRDRHLLGGLIVGSIVWGIFSYWLLMTQLPHI